MKVVEQKRGRFNEEEEEEYGERSHKRQQLKACNSNWEKVCFVCQIEPRFLSGNFGGYCVFISDVSFSSNNNNEEFVPLVRLECSDSFTMCGIDSTLYMLDESRPGDDGEQPLYSLDLQHYYGLQPRLITKRHLKKLPPMSAPKFAPVIHPVPNSKNVLVFTTYPRMSCTSSDYLRSRRCPDNVPATPDDEPSSSREYNCAAFEMYNAHTHSWLTLPTFCIRLTRNLSNLPMFQLYDPLTHSWNKIDVPHDLSCNGHTMFQCRIMRFAFINDHTLLVEIDIGLRLTLDFSSLPQGWKVLPKEEELPTSITNCASADDKKKKKKKKNDIFIINETVDHDWCAFDINQHSVSAPELVPQSPFRHRVKVKHHQRHPMIRLVERQRQRQGRNKNRVCVLRTAIRRRYKYPQMIVDVVDVEQDEDRGKLVASFTSQFKQRCLRFYPICIFVYHPK